MGLDMYLTKRYCVKNWEHFTAERYEVTITKGGEPAAIPVKDIESVTVEAAYWRKANQIHAWFVRHVQEGIDNCAEYYVSGERLGELLGLVRQVLQEHSLARELLPTQEGYFFGDTDYGESYFTDLEDTKRMLEAVLGVGDSADFYYHSSW